MVEMIFVNLAVKDLNKSKEFYSKLGFSFNPDFTDDKGACMIISENKIYAMLLTEKFFAGFIKGKKISDAKKSTEVLNAILLKNKEEVDSMISKAVSAGGHEFREVQDLGFMYSRAFEDLDGHVWEPFFMDKDYNKK